MTLPTDAIGYCIGHPANGQLIRLDAAKQLAALVARVERLEAALAGILRQQVEYLATAHRIAREALEEP